jgi:hypothetical protein
MMALNNLGRLLEMTGPKDMAEPEALYRRVLEKEPRWAVRLILRAGIGFGF